MCKSAYLCKIGKSLRLLIGCAIFVSIASFSLAASPQDPEMKKDEPGMKLASPKSVLLSPAGGRLEFSREMEVETRDGRSVVRFAVPQTASNLQISIPGRTIERFGLEPVNLDIESDLSEMREKLLQEKIGLDASLLAVKARIALLQGIPKNMNAQDVQQLQQTIASSMPELSRKKAELEERARIVEMELRMIPENSRIGRVANVILTNVHDATPRVRVNYSYMFPGCGWQAMYDLDARPGAENNDEIKVRLMAEVWQYSGTDWTDAHIVLASRGNGPREPQPLPEWIVDSTPRPQPRAMPMMLNAKSRATGGAVEEAAAYDGAAPENAPVIADSQGIYATWTLASNDLPEGRSRVVIKDDSWKAPLQWLARPSKNDSRVFLMAKYELPPNAAWPDGMAEYCVNGQSVGSGIFQPHGGEAIIYLGADPRVNVQTTIDSRKQGEKGFINTNKTWTWAWTYTVTNEHDKAIMVRLERPMPMIVDQGVSVSYDDKPEARKDEKKHMLYWVVEVPAHGKTSVEHSITITSPTKLPLLPDVP